MCLCVCVCVRVHVRVRVRVRVRICVCVCACFYFCLCLCFLLVTHERKQLNISVSQGGSKLEKAEVLELTVDYVRNLIRKGKQLILRVIPQYVLKYNLSTSVWRCLS